MPAGENAPLTHRSAGVRRLRPITFIECLKGVFMSHVTFTTLLQDPSAFDGAAESRLIGEGGDSVLSRLSDGGGEGITLPACPGPCTIGQAFLPATRILTPQGMRAVGLLRPGDRLVTRDDGLQPVRRIEARRLGWRALGLIPMLRPVEIAAGAFGPDLPATQLCLAPEHGVAVTLSGSSETATVPAQRLIGCPGVRRTGFHDVTYVALVLDRPALVNVEGLWCAAWHSQTATPPTERATPEIAAA